MQCLANNFDWADVILLAAAEGEEFVQTRVVTLKSHYKELMFDKAFETEETIDNVEHKAKSLMDSGQFFVKEFIQISNGTLLVSVNCEQIDDEAVDRALSFIGEIDNFSEIVNTKREFGKPHTFKYSEVKSNENEHQTSRRTNPSSS